jgi:uncharacterized protein YndB with AHSA1/START domain
VQDESTFVYVTYIAAAPEKVWRALTDGELTRLYWKHENISDWKPGSPWRQTPAEGGRTARIVGEVVEAIPNRRLVLTWADFTNPEAPVHHSRVSFEIEPVADMVRLTVTHSDLSPEMRPRIVNGWPRVFSSLKSLLETGKALDTWA